MKKLMILAAVMALAGTAYARCHGGRCEEENGSRCTEGRCIAPDSFDQGTSRGWGHYQGNDRQQKHENGHENGKQNGRNRRLFRAKKNTSNNQRQTRSRGFPLQMKQKTQS